MPRSGPGVYTLPATYLATTGETIEAQQHNDPLEDLEQDMNTVRPIVAGGTGASTAVGAHDAFSTKGASVASATTPNIASATGMFVHITGTTTIEGFTTATAGIERILVFDDALTFTHNATSLILPGGANITTAANDCAFMVSEGSGNWRCIAYTDVSQIATLAAFAAAFTPASSSTAAGLAFAEDTDNGAHKITLKGQASVAADFDIVLPATTGTLALNTAASESAAGLVELATTAEASTGTDTARAVTPAGLAAGIPVLTAALAYGAVGTYVFANKTATSGFAANSTYAGSSLEPAGINSNTATLNDDEVVDAFLTKGGSALSGTWRAMGQANNTPAAGDDQFATLFLRIS